MAARYAWVLLWGYLDDYGRGLDNARVMAADLFPLDDEVTGTRMGEWLELWADAGSVCRYEHEGKRYLHALNWGDYQRPQHPGKVRIPPCKEHEAVALAEFEAAREATHRKSSGKSHEGFVRVSPTSKEEEEELGVRRRRGRQSLTPRCARHANSPNPPKCGDCKDARLTWERNQDPQPALSVLPPALVCPEHPGQLAGTCNGCAADRKAAR
ncbi:MAG: hypothetical protein ACJ768_25540 [Gaiellaceae bacterium]